MDAPETRIYTAVLITALVLGVIIFYFIVSIIRQQRKIVELHKQNILAEITQIEKERARIAHDLHDELGPLLSGIKMKMNSFELHLKEDQLEMEKTNNHLDDVLKRIREISFDLMPGLLLRKGLEAAVKEFLDNLNNATGINFTFTCENEVNLTEQNSINIYRIIQEIVHNTIKHAGATELQIDLRTIKNNLVMKSTDNGAGFDYDKESAENIGIGLKSLLRRTAITGGQMFVESKKGKGTTYTFKIPV